MPRPINTHHWQGSAAAYAALSEKSGTTLYLNTEGDGRKVTITRFEWMSAAAYSGLADPASTPLYIINESMRGRGTAHRWPLAADGAVAFYLGATPVGAILIGDTAPAIAGHLDALGGGARYRLADTLAAALEAAIAEARPGDVVLLSPACPSYDMFPNYEVRGEQFRKLVLNTS